MRFLMIIFLLAGCTYNIDLQTFNEGTAISGPFKGKKVGVVVLPGSIQDNHKTNTDVYTYSFSNMKAGLVSALNRKISGQASKFDVLEVESLQSLKGEYDFYLFPRLQSRSVHDFWTMGCLITYRLTIKDGKQQLLADVEDKGKRNFFSGDQSGEKCRLAMEEVFEKVTQQAVNSVR